MQLDESNHESSGTEGGAPSWRAEFNDNYSKFRKFKQPPEGKLTFATKPVPNPESYVL